VNLTVAKSASPDDLAPANKPYRPIGNCLTFWKAHEPEVLFAGPAGTGKSRAVCERLNWLATKYPGMRGLIIRKTRESLTQSGLVTLKNDVIVEGTARWYDNREWQYPNGSVLVTGGMDKPSKIMSSEYDVIYVQEATELLEDDWEHLLTRVRGQAMPYTQIIADCNPAGANHWLLKRAQSGRLRIVDSRHQDNPVLYDGETPTEFGKEYLAKLDSLTGVRRKRLLLGLWVTAEGVVYDEFDRDVHMVDRFKNLGYGSPPKHWRRFWAVDFGYTHPFVWSAFAQDPESGDLYRFRELYHTGLLVEEVADEVQRWMVREHEEFPSAIICDHDAEGRATLHKKWGVPTIAAKKAVSLGIQATKKRLGTPGLFFLRDSALRVDQSLQDAKRPICTEDEFEMYVWREGVKDSEPVKDNDHGMDALRYLVMHVDGKPKRTWTGGGV
jgi:PBSX family phage terminase large subunit